MFIVVCQRSRYLRQCQGIPLGDAVGVLLVILMCNHNVEHCDCRSHDMRATTPNFRINSYEKIGRGCVVVFLQTSVYKIQRSIYGWKFSSSVHFMSPFSAISIPSLT